MKYYKYSDYIDMNRDSKYCEQEGDTIWFFLNHEHHNEKGPAWIDNDGKSYWLNNFCYADINDDKFKSNKEWRRYCKLLVFI